VRELQFWNDLHLSCHYLDKFLIESSKRQRGSFKSKEEDAEDNIAPIASSKSNLSEFSIHIFVKDVNIVTQESSPSLQVILLSSSTSVPASKD
jgi:hypothetical protein